MELSDAKVLLRQYLSPHGIHGLTTEGAFVVAHYSETTPPQLVDEIERVVDPHPVRWKREKSIKWK